MTTDKGYNGWTNYQTWVAALWMGEACCHWEDEAETCASAADGDDGEARRMFAKLAEDYYAEELHAVRARGLLADLLGHALGAIDWEEIAEHYTETACEEWRQMQAEAEEAASAEEVNS